jgi:hypothetical protein
MTHFATLDHIQIQHFHILLQVSRLHSCASTEELVLAVGLWVAFHWNIVFKGGRS